jgi:hypothetical protein
MNTPNINGDALMGATVTPARFRGCSRSGASPGARP